MKNNLKFVENKILSKQWIEKRYRKKKIFFFIYQKKNNYFQELARLARLEYAEQIQKDKELHDIIQADKAEAKHKEHIQICTRITWQLVDFALKIGEYRQLTEK